MTVVNPSASVVGVMGDPLIVAPPGFHMATVANNSTLVALTPRGWRVQVRRSGTLHDVSTAIQVQSGNYALAVYDTGDAAGSGTRTLLWATPGTGGLVVPGTGWAVLGDPGVSVYQGQQLDVYIAADNAVASFVRPTATAIASQSQWPSVFNVVPGGALPKMFSSLVAIANLNNASWPTTVVEGNVAASTNGVALIGRVS